MHWREDVLTLPHCQAQVGGRQGLIFIGPRIKMGIYEGVPTRVAPHTTTGSADYFGPLVNRYTTLLMSHVITRVSYHCVSIAEQESELLHSLGKPHCLLLRRPQLCSAPCFCIPDPQKAWLLT